MYTIRMSVFMFIKYHDKNKRVSLYSKSFHDKEVSVLYFKEHLNEIYNELVPQFKGIQLYKELFITQYVDTL